MSDLHESESWRTYPQNLPLQGSNAYGYDCLDYTEQLEHESDRLFITGPSICVKVVELVSQDRYEHIFTKPDEFDYYFQRPRAPGAIRLILIPQESSWGKLRITQECMLRLVTILQVFPAFIDVLRAFGQKTAVMDESYGGFYFQENKHARRTECAYTVKYPEEHGRDGPHDPWSLRQMGVYQQLTRGGDSTFIILHPSKSFMRRLKRAMSPREMLAPWEIQMMALSAAMEKWRWYISELEKRFIAKKTNAQLSSMSEKDPAALTFGDTQDIQVLQDKLSQSLHYLTMNHEVIRQIQLKCERITGDDSEPEDQLIATLIVQALMETNRVKSLLKRAEGTQALAQSILDFTCLESMRGSSRTMTKLQKLSQEEAELLLALTMKASRDTDILKTLTMLTLIYLPASLVSSMMGMGYINVVTEGKKMSIQIQSEMWIFFVLVVILLVATMGGYYVWLRNKRAKRNKNFMNAQRKKQRLSW